MRRPINKKISFLIAGVACVALIGFFFIRDENSFPIIPQGYYSGTISGLSPQTDKHYTFFIQKKADQDELIAIAFTKNWEPQIIPLEFDQATDGAKLRPIRIEYLKTSYTLSGRQKGNTLQGTVRAFGNKVGRWSLGATDVTPKDLPGVSAAQLSNWLRLKGKLYSLKEQQTQILKEIKVQQGEITLLSKILESKEKLQETANQEINDLNEALTEKKAETSKIVKEIKDKARSLQQLTRITRRGRAIDLARRVAKRENKWYLVNWGDSSNTAISEEALAERMNVDMRKLSGQLSQSEEYLRLKGTIAVERRKIRELQNLIEEKSRPRKQERQRPERQKKPWWEKWDTLFG